MFKSTTKNMKQYLRIYMVLLLALVAGASTSFGQEETFNFVNWGFNGASDWNTEYSARTVKGTIATVKFASANKNSSTITECPVTKGGNITVTLNDTITYNITGVTLTLKQWGNNTQTVTLSTSTDGSTFTRTDIKSSKFTLSTDSLSAKAIRFSFSNTKKQVGVQSIKITYTSTGSPKTKTTTSFGETIDNKTVTVNEGEEGNFTPPTATLSPAEAGTLTYSSSNTDVATVDDKGNITFGTAFGETTITALFAGNDTYAKSSASYTLDHKKYVIPRTTVFSKAAKSFENVPTTSYSTGDYILKSEDGNEYTFKVKNGKRETDKLVLKRSSGEITSPSFQFEYGYTVTVKYYRAGSNELTISSGSKTATGTAVATETSNQSEGTGFIAKLAIPTDNASFTIKSGNVSYISNITIVPFTEAQKQTAEVSFPSTSYTAYGTTFDAPKATVKDSEGNTIEDATVTYAMTGDAIGTINVKTGDLTLNNTSGTATVSATFAGNDKYSEASASYTLEVKELVDTKDIADFITKGTAESSKIYRLTLKDAKVLYKNYSNLFVRDASGAINIYGTGLEDSASVTANAIVNGTIIGKYDEYKGLPELVSADNLTTADNLTITPSEEVAEPVEISTDDIAKYVNNLVTVKNGTVIVNGSGNNKTYSVFNGDDVTALIYDKFKIGYDTPYDNANVDVTGIVVKYNEDYDICPIEKYGIVYNFRETEKNYTMGVGPAKVALTRTLSSEYWNTFCIPFALTAEQVAEVFGEGTQITEYTGTTANGVMEFNAVTAIENTVPYLIKPAKTVVNPVIEGVKILYPDAKAVGTDVQFVGTYSPVELATDGTEIFIGKDGRVFAPAAGKNKINGMRAYIKKASATASVAAISFNGGVVTAVDGVELEGADSLKVYNLNGQCVGNGTKGLKKGLYIVNGKKLKINK